MKKCGTSMQWAIICQQQGMTHWYKPSHALPEHYVEWKKLVAKTTYLSVPFTCNIQNRQIHRDKVTWWLHRTEGCLFGEEGEERGVTAQGTGFLWGVIKKHSKIDCTDGCTNSMNIRETTELYTRNGWSISYVNYTSILQLQRKVRGATWRSMSNR